MQNSKTTKRVITLSLAALMSCGLLFAGGCKSEENNGDKKAGNNGNYSIVSSLKELLSAESFTVSKENSVIFQYENAKAYWNRNGDEYYFSAESGGKKWVYSRDFKADEWVKEAFSDYEYVRYLYMYRNGLGIEESLMDVIDLICMDFDSCMTEIDGKFTLKQEFREELKCWVSNDTLKFEYEDTIYSIYDINNSKVSVSDNVKQNAKVGEVDLP